MKSIGILILGLLVGQASAATDYYHTGVYGRAGKHGTDDGSTFPTALPAPDDKLINKHPLIIRPGQMARISDCKKGIPGSHCEIVFTDVGGHTIRKLITEPYVKGDPNEQPHAIRTLIGKAGDPGCLDGTGTKVIIPCGGKDDSGSDSDHESGHKKHSKKDSGSDSDHESGHKKHSKEGSGLDSDHEFGHRRHSIDGYVSEEDSDSGIGNCHKSAFQKVVKQHRRGSDGSIHEDDDRGCAEDLAGDLLDGYESELDMRKSPTKEHCKKDGSDSDSESGRLAMPLAQFNHPLGIAALPYKDGNQFLVSDTKTSALRLEMPFGLANYLAQTISRGNPENPRFITSNGKDTYYCAAGDCIVEVDPTQKPPVKVIAGRMEVGGDVDWSAAMTKAMQKTDEDYKKEIARLLRDEGSDSDDDSCSGEKILVTPLHGACGIAYTTEGSSPTIYYTERDLDTIGKLVQTGGNWAAHPVAPGEKFVKPTSISVTEDGKSQIVVDAEGVKLVQLDPDKGTYTVTTIVPMDNAISAEIGCDGDIYVGRTDHRIDRYSPRVPDGPVNPPSGANAGAIANNGNAAIARSQVAADGMEDAEFRFSLSSEQIMLTMRQRGVNFAESGGNDSHSRALNALEKAVDATHAIKQIGKGMTFWASGLYTQGSLDPMFGNHAMKLKHYAIMAGTHYKDSATQQIFGVAVNVGFGNSISKSDKDMRTDNKSAQITLYYNKKLDKELKWKFSWHNTLMRSMDRHQRPYTDNGNRQIAIGNGVTYEFSSMAEVSYKHEFCRDNYLKPFTSLNYTLNKEMAYKEKNAGNNNLSYGNAGMDQLGIQFGIKSSFGKKISETKTFVMMPKISYTNFVKMGKATQTSTNEVSGVTKTGSTGTPGRHLISATLSAGVVDYEANTTTKFSYTGSVQKQKRNHEFLLDWGMKF